ncbi:MAG: helix-turn-helix domain-containing protein [Solirubrobacteraceae bacterium]
MKDENTTGVLPAGTENGRLAGRPKSGGPSSSRAASSRQWQRAGRPRRRPARSNGSAGLETITIELSKAQVDQIVRAAGQGGTMSVLLSALKDPNWTLALDSEEWAYPAQMEDRRLSRSLLSGLLVLSCFPADGGYLGIAELARTLGMNTSTTHRYVTTLLAVGLLERDPATRRYRLAAP